MIEDFTELEIEKNVPLPEKPPSRMDSVHELLTSMEVGDSVRVIGYDESACNILRKEAKKLGMLLTARFFDNGGSVSEGYHRVWRIK